MNIERGEFSDTPSERLIPERSTGTVDDLDEREDERDDENEIPVGVPSDQIEAPEEFEDNDEPREPIEKSGTR